LREERQVGIHRLTLVSGPEQALEVVGDGEVWFRLQPSAGGYKVEAPMHRRRFRLNPQGVDWRLTTWEDPNAERVLWSLSPGRRTGIAGSSLLLQDGSLYLIEDRPGMEPGYDLCGWQTAWPYFTASFMDGAWTVQVHPSGATLIQEGRGVDLLILFVAAVSGLQSGSSRPGEEIS